MEKTGEYTDSEIIGKVVSGDLGLFEILIRRYNPHLYKTGRAYNYSHEDTQDLMQETFIDAYFSLSKFESRSAFKTWIVKIMLNNCYRRQQKSSFKNEIRSNINEDASPLFSSPTDTGKTVMNKELNRVIERALSEIPENYRVVFILREINGMNVAETAEALNLTESNVKVRLNRAKTMLRGEIEKSYSPDEIFEFNLVYCNAVVKNVMERIQALRTEA